MDNHYLPDQQFVDLKDFLRESKVKFRDCNTSIIVPKFGEAFHVSSYCKNGMTPGIATYNALKASHISDGAPYRWTAPEMAYLSCESPSFYLKSLNGYTGYICSIDLDSSYYQIYRHLSWRGRYPTKKMKYFIGDTFDHLSDWKAARSAVVGIARSRYEKWDTGGQVEKVRKELNPYLSPYLWKCVSTILGIFAKTAVSMGAVYVDTDGYLFLDPGQAMKFKEFLSNCEMDYHSFENANSTFHSWQWYEIGDDHAVGREYSGRPDNRDNLKFASEKDLKLFRFYIERKFSND